MLLDFLFPPTCLACGVLLAYERPYLDADADADAELPLCVNCAPSHEALAPAQRRVEGIEALFPYEGALGAAMRRFKFTGETALAGPLGALLGRAPSLYESPQGRPWDFVTTVPLHPTRHWARGFDQSRLLASWALWHARESLGASLPELRCDLLRRVRATPPQSELGAAERATNLRGAFSCPRPERVRGCSVLVIDDVTSTGSTLGECLSLLQRAGARELGGLALLRQLPHGRSAAQPHARKGRSARRSLG